MFGHGNPIQALGLNTLRKIVVASMVLAGIFGFARAGEAAQFLCAGGDLNELLDRGD